MCRLKISVARVRCMYNVAMSSVVSYTFIKIFFSAFYYEIYWHVYHIVAQIDQEFIIASSEAYHRVWSLAYLCDVYDIVKNTSLIRWTDLF